MVINLVGYQIKEQLYAGTRTVVHRGIRTEDSVTVVIKFLRNEYPTFYELVQFRNQYTIAKKLNFPNIIKPLTLEVYHNGYALVMEDFGGISLFNYLQTILDKNPQSKYLPLAEFLEIAIQLTDTLHYLYQNQVIHKDIKPANILINPDTKQVKLIDFSISSLLPRENQEIQNPNILEGTLPYLSPEQTGRMNRGIDYRTDFYSLGITFYELLTGILPFSAENAMELVHCHLAKTPKPIHQINQSIPLILSKIIKKLMAKNAENRYQSALGIKYDLENCLTQLKSTGKIHDFEIGKQDISDRFLIPETLYGREKEVNQLLNAFDRVSINKTEMILVAGFSGIGKTTVINEIHKPIVRKKGYFIKGKYDQFQRNIPFSAFLQAFRDLIGQLLSESDQQLQTWKTQILAALGENGQVLIDVIPELENIIGKQPPAIKLSGNAVQNRFNLLFQKFVQVFTIKEHPLVIFLDDLQWSDSASLDLLKLLIQDPGHLLVLGAYRDHEVSPIHPLIQTIDDLVKNQASVQIITLFPLIESDLNRLVADTLNCELSPAQPLTQLIYQKTQGNPFFTTQFLKVLHDKKLITFNWDSHHWQCDISQVNTLAVTNDVVEFMALQLQKLPIETQDILKLSACIGATFDLHTVAIISQQSETEAATVLWRALQEGLILPVTDVYKFYQLEDDHKFSREDKNTNQQNAKYRFLHDRVQQAAYSLIPANQKQATHLQIGQLLQHHLSETEKEERLFDIVGHFNLAQELITEPKTREILARMNLAATQKAKNSTAYSAARKFVQTGLELLSANCWESQYELTLNLYIAATESAYLNGEFQDTKIIADQALQSAKNILDKVKIYEILINTMTAQGQMLEAIAIGQNALTQLGIQLSGEADETLIANNLQNLAQKLQDKSIEELVDLPLMSDPHTIAAMQLLAMLFTPIFLGNPTLLPQLCSIMVSLSLEFGNAPASTMGYIGYGVVLSSFLGEVERGYEFGRLALTLVDRLEIRELKSITLLFFGSFIQHLQEALRAAIPTRKQGYLAGIKTGNFLDASYNIVNYFYDSFLAGVAFDDWEIEMENYSILLVNLKQNSPLNYLKLLQQTADNLREVVDQPDLLIGSNYDETVIFPKYHQDNELSAFVFAYTYKLILAYLFGNYNQALDYIAQININLMATAKTIYIPIFHFYASLTYLSLGLGHSEMEQANTLKLVENHQNILAQWARYAPMNHLHKWYLVEAQRQHFLGNNAQAIDNYDRAISGAKENQYIQEEALANELAAKFYLTWSKEKIASVYMQDAYYCYAKWGAKAKVINLEKSYPKLLAPILEKTHPTDLFQEIISRSTITSGQTSSGISEALDLSTLLKASQAISGEIELNQLLITLLKIVIANAGANKCVFILKQDLDLNLVALVEDGKSPQLLPSIPLESSPDVPISLVNHVKRNLKPLVLTDGRINPQFMADSYLQKYQPKSILCIPIINQRQLIGVLYLENQLTVGAFTSDRIQVLNLICSQAAISLENARLYQVAQQALTELQHAQIQIVQSEKMSALGNLVAGIAHEINNPVSFLSGNIQPALDYINDLFNLLDLVQEQYPELDSKVKQKITAIELDYIREDLPQLVGSMAEGVKRIQDISISLRTFSRADQDYPVAGNIHDGIDSTLMILRHRLKANNIRPEIQVIKDYGDLPLIQCYAGQLNQVFMNILSNAIDAVEESNQGSSYETINNQIMIKTELSSDQKQAIIRIQDNGIGMSQQLQDKIFNHLFTTKAVGKGTGLGLAIARQIIVEKHSGILEVSSSLNQGSEFIISIPC